MPIGLGRKPEAVSQVVPLVKKAIRASDPQKVIGRVFDELLPDGCVDPEFPHVAREDHFQSTRQIRGLAAEGTAVLFDAAGSIDSNAPAEC
jgi:hypothetical protein